MYNKNCLEKVGSDVEEKRKMEQACAGQLYDASIGRPSKNGLRTRPYLTHDAMYEVSAMEEWGKSVVARPLASTQS